MHKLFFLLFCCLAIWGSSASAADATPEAAPIAIITNRALSMTSITTSQLREIILGGVSKWPDGTKVIVVGLGPGTKELQTLLKAFNMSERDLTKYYLQTVFQGKTVNMPKFLADAVSVKAAVVGTPGAIGYIPAKLASPEVSILSVDGASLKDANYKFK